MKSLSDRLWDLLLSDALWPLLVLLFTAVAVFAFDTNPTLAGVLVLAAAICCLGMLPARRDAPG